MSEIDLPPNVENSINKLLSKKKELRPPGSEVRQKLANVGEKEALAVLSMAYNTNARINTLDGYIAHLIDIRRAKPLNRRLSAPATAAFSPPPQVFQNGYGVSPVQGFQPLQPIVKTEANFDAECLGHQILKRHADLSSPTSIKTVRHTKICKQLSFSDNVPQVREVAPLKISPEAGEEPAKKSYQAIVFSKELDHNREFLIYNYIGRQMLEDVVTDDVADDLLEWMKDKSMGVYETKLWEIYGHKYCSPKDRRQDFDWNSEKSFLYYCEVSHDGRHKFKGPVLSTTTTHLHRTLGDENVLIVKFLDVGSPCNIKTLENGIQIGLKHFCFFVSKDEGKPRKKKYGREGNEIKATSTVKCYFIRRESLSFNKKNPSCDQPISELRCHFMHIHNVPSLPKYISRFSLILSKTVKLPIDFSTVVVERIDDIPCLNEKGEVIFEAGEALILTDGTGFISEDLARKCPSDFSSAKYIKEKEFKKMCMSAQMLDVLQEQGMVELNTDPPLLMQCRLFSKGSAVKGTLLINRKLKAGTIQVRPSMVKVETDVNCGIAPTFDSLEIVAISHKPGRCYLSKNLIALLSYGGVPNEFFLDLLSEALKQSQNVFYDYRAALKVAINGQLDENEIATRMILAGVPLEEPYLQTCLATLARFERTSLGEGKLPISDSFYLMGTVDPTGSLERDEVCVILGYRQITGKVLVYRNPGLHFGDVHILEAKHVENLEDIVGDAKYGIFFSTKGHRSVAAEMGNGDFDGDTYWVSINSELLSYFKPSPPWTRVISTPPAVNKKPAELSAEDVEDEYIRVVLDKKPSSSMGIAADSWMAFMDSLLIQGNNKTPESEELRQKIRKLIDLYYDALDAPKTGKEVNIPWNLRAEKYPHFMKRNNSYTSTSVLGQLFDKTQQFQCGKQATREISKLADLIVEIPEVTVRMEFWRKKHAEYRHEMSVALKNEDEDIKRDAANKLIRNYKQMLYEAPELKESPRKKRDIYNDALAIYHVTYNHAIKCEDVAKCSFAWRVAASALCRYHGKSKAQKDHIIMVPSVLPYLKGSII